jgi:hypothetical protein
MSFPAIEEEAYDRLQRAGWTLGIYSLAGQQGVLCVVEGVNGENVIRSAGDTVEAAYRVFAANGHRRRNHRTVPGSCLPNWGRR